MSGGTLVVSRAVNWHGDIKKRLEGSGFRDVSVTCKEKDALNMLINGVNPRNILIGSNFYRAATPYMVGRMIRDFPKVNFSVISSGYFPDDLAVWFIFRGAKSYVKLADGMEEFRLGLKCIREGISYIAPDVRHIIDGFPGRPEVKDEPDKRQLEVLVMLCNGNRPVDIANKLHVSKRTVDWHIEELCKVFHVRGRDELTGIAFYLDIVTKDDLCFFDRRLKETPLPKWAVIQRTMNGEQRIKEQSLRR